MHTRRSVAALLLGEHGHRKPPSLCIAVTPRRHESVLACCPHPYEIVNRYVDQVPRRSFVGPGGACRSKAKASWS